MAADSQAQLVVKLEARLDQIGKQMVKAGKLAEDAVKKIENEFHNANLSVNTRGIENSMRSMTLAVSGLGGVFAGISLDKIVRAFTEANRQVAQLGDTARRVGIDVEKFQEIRGAGERKGIEGKIIDQGLEGLAKNLNNARNEENELSKLFEINNIKLRDREGKIISTNQALEVAADLIRRAATEMDKVDIAEKFGLPKEMIPFLEGGVSELRKLQEEARNAGAVISADLIEKAKEFDTMWNNATTSAINGIKSFVVESIKDIRSLIGAIGEAADALAALGNGVAKGVAAAQAATAAQQATILEQRLRDPGLSDLQRKGLQQQLSTAQASVRAAQGRQQLQDNAIPDIPAPNMNVLPNSAPLPPRRPSDDKFGFTKTNTGSGRSGGGGGGGGGVDPAEQAEDRLNRYIEALTRTTAVEQARLETMGRSRAEQLAAMEIAKAMPDLNKLDADTRQQIIDKLTQQVAALENVRGAVDKQKQAMQGLNDTAQFAGQSIISIGEAFAEGGGKGEEALKRLGKQILNLVAQAALLGQGPFASLFGLAPATGTGSVGGLLGAIVGGLTGTRASGGPVRSGGTYLVGEKGPELLRMGGNGYVTPNHALPRAGGGSGQSTLNITLSMAGANGDEAVARIAREQAAAAVRIAVQGEASRQKFRDVRFA